MPPPPYSIPVLGRCFRRASQHPSRPRRPSCQPPTPPHSPVIYWCCHRSGRYTSPPPSPTPAVLPPFFSFPRVFLLTWMIRGIVLLSYWRGAGLPLALAGLVRRITWLRPCWHYSREGVAGSSIAWLPRGRGTGAVFASCFERKHCFWRGWAVWAHGPYVVGLHISNKIVSARYCVSPP